MAMTMMMMAVMSTENHVPQGQDTKQTQHCDVPPFRRFACTRYLVRVYNTIWEAGNTGPLLQNMNGYFSKEKSGLLQMICEDHRKQPSLMLTPLNFRVIGSPVILQQSEKRICFN
jgi:hypothetical protein